MIAKIEHGIELLLKGLTNIAVFNVDCVGQAVNVHDLPAH